MTPLSAAHVRISSIEELPVTNPVALMEAEIKNSGVMLSSG